jgi:hypothetical protein
MDKKSPPSPTAADEHPPTILHLETAESWRGRPGNSKLYMIARETAWRLEGMSSVVFAMGLAREHIRPECSFLGRGCP